MTDTLPTVPFGPVEITRLVSGGNPLCGNSHFSRELNQAMREYYTPERVVEYLHACRAAGINTLQARGDYHRILYWLELFRREGGQVHWIAQTASEMHDVGRNVRILAAAGAVGIYHHGTQTDRLWHEGRIDEVRDLLARIRDAGCRVGLGTHIPEVIDHAESAGWDVDFYMACVYNLSRHMRQSALVDPSAPQAEEFREDDPPVMYETIRRTPRQCLAFKILGATRRCATPDHVRQAFDEAFENIKPHDAVVVGMYPIQQVALNAAHTRAVLAPKADQPS